ncbi:MAG TPA: UDP-N-acetylmuramate--L-alanine ligase [Bacillota bacterium]
MSHYHFIGIGGSGMSGIAKVLLQMGHRVSGSDLAASANTRRLTGMGAEVKLGHRADNLAGPAGGDRPDVVVVSSAIRPGNEELDAARRSGLPIRRRAEVLAEIMRTGRGVAVAGCHGKTTTSSMIALMMEGAGLDPTFVVGGEVRDLGTNAALGRGAYVVAEADESDGSFLDLSPVIAVVTNIEADHLDHYGDLGHIIEAFEAFLRRLPQAGLAVLGYDNEWVRQIGGRHGGRKVTYALDEKADLTTSAIGLRGIGTSCTAYLRGKQLGRLELAVPGRHNVQDALAAVAVGLEAGLSFVDIATALKGFTGAERRFQKVGEARGVTIVDDYAHHPTEIAATLRSARQLGYGRVICVFQPHRYTRTQHLAGQFGGAFTAADQLYLMDIYPAGELPIPGVSGRTILDQVAASGYKHVSYHCHREELVETLARDVRPGDLVLTVGAGNVTNLGPELLRVLQGP